MAAGFSTALFFTAPAATANVIFDTEMLSMSLSGGAFPMPLATDPSNTLGDSIDGYGFVNTDVTFSLSVQRVSPGPSTLGIADAENIGGDTPGSPPIDPAALDGQSYSVVSAFDVFFDITLTDVDTRPGRDFFGQSDGAALQYLDVGPGDLQAFYGAVFDQNHETFDLFPADESDPFIGFFGLVIPLGADVNGTGNSTRFASTWPRFRYWTETATSRRFRAESCSSKVTSE